MKHYSYKILAAFILSAAIVFPALSGEAGNMITRDPFAHPDLKKRKQTAVAIKRSKSPRERIIDEAANLELRATIRTGDWSMANINGAMIEQGGMIDGFRLLKVGEVDVLLLKEGVEVFLVMETSNSLPAQ